MTNPMLKRPGKLPTGIPGLDSVLITGIPEFSLTIIAGPPGSGKTLLTQQLLYHNAGQAMKALYLTTLSESPAKMLNYLRKFTFFQADKVGSEVIYFDMGETVRKRRLNDCLAVILERVKEHKPSLLAIDSFKAIHDFAKDPAEERHFGYDLSVQLNSLGVTTFLVGEYSPEEMEQRPIFTIADGIIRFHHRSHEFHHPHYLDIRKMRGEDYLTGFHPFTVDHTGIAVYPHTTAPDIFPDFALDMERTTTGVPELDLMLEGGIVRGTTTMLAGNPGTGKTLLGLHFITAGAMEDEPGLIVTFRENPVQLKEMAHSFEWNLQALEEQGLIMHWYQPPSGIEPDIFCAHLRTLVERLGARRLFVDAITDIQAANPNIGSFKEYVYSMANEFKLHGITAMLTIEIPELFGDFPLSGDTVYSVADNVILLRYVELSGRMRRAIHVLKARGSQHSKEIREFDITNVGFSMGKCLNAITGILSGTPVFSEYSSLLYLPLRARYVVESLKQRGLASLADLMRLTGLSRRDLLRQIEELQQQKIVVAIERGDETIYKVGV